MILSIGFTILKLFGKGWTERAARYAGIGALAVLLVLALSVGKCAYDRSVIEDHEAGVLGKAREADHTADAATAPAKARFEAEQARLAEEAAKAARGDPTGAAKPVGPVSRSYYDNLPENP